MKMKLCFAFLIAILYFSSPASAIYLGTVEGYVLNTTGPVPGAQVNVTVSGCTESCSASTTTDSNGYYVAANLNIPAGGTATVAAQKSNMYATNSGTADAYFAAFVNVTFLCSPPWPPTLTPVADSHNNSLFLFSWLSGADPGGLPTYDVWIFDGTQYSSVASPQNRSNLVFGAYSWGVKTCSSAVCCSSTATDSFSVVNSAPTAPVLVDQTNTINNTVTLSWSSSVDADSDPIYYNFIFDGAVASNVTSPRTKTGLSYGSHSWGVQACDPWTCSAWSTDTFSVINNPPTAPTLVHQNHTSLGYVILIWVSGIDPDGDPVHDDYIHYIYNTTGYVEYNRTSPQIETLNGTNYYWWGVRTCDNKGACSSWVYDGYIRFEAAAEAAPCPQCPVCAAPGTPCPVPPKGTCPRPESVPGGSAGQGTGGCQEKWVCENWNPCGDNGIEYRDCAETNNCGTTCGKPDVLRKCSPAPEPLGVSTESARPEAQWIGVTFAFLLIFAGLMLYISLRRKF